MILNCAFGNIPWNSNFDTVNEMMELIDFNNSEDDECHWKFKGILPSPDMGDARCTVSFGHEGLNELIDCALLVEFDGNYLQLFFDFYLEILSDKYGQPKFIDKNKHEAIWYHVDDLNISDLSGKLILHTDENTVQENIKVSYYHPDYKNLLHKAFSMKKNIIKQII